MFKKIIAITVLLLFSASAFALTGSYLAGSAGLINVTNKQGSSDYRGMNANLALGYGGMYSACTYLAGEVFGVPGTIAISSNTTLKITYGVGASLLGGMLMTEKTIGYLRLGVIGSRFTNQKKNVAGGQFGLGLQTNFCQNWDLRGEYVYAKYRSFGSVSSPTVDGFNVGLVVRMDN